MNKLIRALLPAAAILAFAGPARGDDGAPSYASQDTQPSKLDDAAHAINAMQEVYATSERKEEEAKEEHDPVRLNCVHQNNARMSDLIAVAAHDLEDLRLAVSTHQPEDAIDGELDDILKVKRKVEQIQKDEERCVGIKVVGADNGEGETVRDFTNSGQVSDDPLAELVSSTALPGLAMHNPPASPIGGQ